MRMQLPTDVIFHHDLRLMVWRPRGVVDENAVNKIIGFMGKEEARSNQPFNRFTDTSVVETVELNFKYIFHVSLFRRLSYSGRPPVKSAILTSNEGFAHYSRMHQVLTQGSPLKVRLFEDRGDAAKWLSVSPESLDY